MQKIDPIPILFGGKQGATTDPSKGTLRLTSTSGEHRRQDIANALYVPDARLNLISLSALT